MSIQLRYDEDFSKGLKRLMIEECKTAIGYLDKSQTDEEKHQAVHEVRKAFKKIRGCLRLVRDHIDYYKEENVWFRDWAREISDIRDATANIEILDALEKQYDSELYENAFDKLHKKLLQQREDYAEGAFHNDNLLKNLRQAIEEKVEVIPGWPLNIQTFDDIRPSLKRTYKRGYKGVKKAAKTGKIEDFHEWRKRAKYLRYQIDVLNRTWPNMLEVYEDELHDITDFTGTLNDLQNLQHTINDLEEPFESREEKMLFNAITQKHKKVMKRHALLKGKKCYFDDPSKFCDRMKVFWDTHLEVMQREDLPQTTQLESI